MGIISAAIVVVSIVLAYWLYRRRPAREPALAGYWGLLFAGFYLDRLYQLIFVRPYQALARFLWRQVDDRYDRQVIVGGARALFRPYWALAKFCWLKVDELVIDEGVVKAADGLVACLPGPGVLDHRAAVHLSEDVAPGPDHLFCRGGPELVPVVITEA